MAITIDDFSKIWASSSPLTPYEFSENNYKQGWNFVGGTPPSRQMWDFLQKQNDEKLKYLLDNFDNYLPLSGGTMTGNIFNNNADDLFAIGKDPSVLNQGIRIYGGSSFSSGASVYVYGKDNASYGGMFRLFAHDGTNSKELRGTPNGELTWNGNDITPQTATEVTTATEVSVANNTIQNLLNFQLTKGTWLVQIAGIFTANATGYREMFIGNSASSGTIDRFKTITSNAVSGTVTRLSLTTVISVASTTTYYLNVKQTSGGALNVGGGVRMFRLSSIS